MYGYVCICMYMDMYMYMDSIIVLHIIHEIITYNTTQYNLMCVLLLILHTITHIHNT